MKRLFLHPTFALLISVLPAAAQSPCYADYKAKQDNPLRLHYGVAEIRGGCDAGTATVELRARLSAQGWTLLNVVGVFGADGLQERKDNAGSYYLRF